MKPKLLFLGRSEEVSLRAFFCLEISSGELYCAKSFFFESDPFVINDESDGLFRFFREGSSNLNAEMTGELITKVACGLSLLV